MKTKNTITLHKKGFPRHLLEILSENYEIPRTSLSLYPLHKQTRITSINNLINHGLIGERPVNKDRTSKGLFLTQKGCTYLGQEKIKYNNNHTARRYRTLAHINTFYDTIGVKTIASEKILIDQLPTYITAAKELNAGTIEHNGLDADHFLVDKSILGISSVPITKESYKHPLHNYGGTYYTSYEVKDKDNNQLRYSKIAGLLVTDSTEYLVYPFSKKYVWYEDTEIGINLFLRSLLVKNSLKSINESYINNIIFMPKKIRDVPEIFRQKTKGCIRKIDFLKTMVKNLYCVPSDSNGQLLLPIMLIPDWDTKIQETYPEYENLIGFNLRTIAKLNFLNKPASILCLDWQLPHLKKMLPGNTTFATITIKELKTIFELPII